MIVATRTRALSACMFLFLAPSLAAQQSSCLVTAVPVVDLADSWAQRLRFAQLEGAASDWSLTIRRPSSERKVSYCTAGDSGVTPGRLAADLLPVRSRTLYNSAYPLEVNTGAAWVGKGVTSVVEAGAEIHLGAFSAGIYPAAAYQQNSDFAIREDQREGMSRFAYAGHRDIDWPQRPGEDAFWTLHPGQSFVRFDVRGFVAGVSTENLWIGSAQRMPLMMSTTAGGFPHFFIGTARPVDIYIGSLETQFFWGRISESDHFDGNPDNDHNVLVGTTAVFQPALIPGLFLGLHRSWIVPWGIPEWSVVDYVVQPFVNIRENPGHDNKLLAAFGRWVLAPSQFEVYAEWAREDGWGEWADFLREPDHSQAYVLGLQKLADFGSAKLRWWGELAHLEPSMALRSGRGAVTLYTHATLRQGYTNRGQLLGAWIGPGSDAQIIGVDRLAGDRSTGVALERVRFDADAYYNLWASSYAHNGYDAALSLWLRHSEPVGRNVLVNATAAVARRQNRNFVLFTGAQPPNLKFETNVHFDVEFRWVPRR